MQRNHDPRRVLPLVELILSLNIDPTSHAAKKLLFVLFVSTLHSTFSWHMLSKTQPLLAKYFAILMNKYAIL